MQQQDEEVLELSPEAQAALAAFGRERGLDIDEGADARDVLQKVHASCMPDDKEERFQYRYGEGTPEEVTISLLGWKKELSQRLESTGLTIWRAAEDLARYVFERRSSLLGQGSKKVLELGAGLGLCGLLAARLNPQGVVVLSDGDALTMEKLTANIEQNVVKNGCAVTPRTLVWGQHHEMADEFPDGFDLLLAADVLYEPQAVRPLLETAKALLKQSSVREEEGLFLLAFARRNVSEDVVVGTARELGFTVERDSDFQCSVPGEAVFRLKL